MSEDSPFLRMAIGFGGLSLFSVGGALSILSDVHKLVVDQYHWMSDADFVRIFAIAQIAPGPNMLSFSMMGWRIAGLAGLLVVTLSAVAPPTVLAFFVGRGFERFSHAPWFPAVKLGLGPLVVGLYTASGVVAAQAADDGVVAVLITVGVAAYVTFSRRNPMWCLLAGAICGGLAASVGWH